MHRLTKKQLNRIKLLQKPPTNNASRVDDILHRLTSLHPKAIDPGLERTLRILNDLGNPHLKLPPVLHIAGTNGKGSTQAFMRSIAQAAGLTVHAMTSPHLVKFNERIVIASREISDKNLVALLERTEELNASKGVTFFEITTAAGLLAFAENNADLCILETGMGGRLDSTNVVPNPALTIITNISLDHVKFLGNDLRSIAGEKAGIMKANTPCVIGPQTKDALADNVMDVFETRARELNAPLFRYGHEWDFTQNENGFTLRFLDQQFDLPRPNLLGDHQIANAATAVAGILALKEFDHLKNKETLSAGLLSAAWPARLQKLTNGSLANLLPPHWDLYLDGGHNEAGGKILADQAREWTKRDNKKIHLIVGMLTTKDPEPFFDHLRPYVETATAIPIPDEPLAFTEKALAEKLGIQSAANVTDALQKISLTHDGHLILIAGSLYLAGHILAQNK